MTLTRTPMRRCGKRYGTEDEARDAALLLTARSGRPGEFIPGPCWAAGCGGFHVGYRKAASERPEQKAPKDTGPSQLVRAAVMDRDGHCCACCGQPVEGSLHSIGHRKRRSQGGSSLPSNLLLFLGLGNGLLPDDHHYRIDQRRDPRDEERGLTVRRSLDPRLVAVEYHLPGGSGFTRYLGDDGSLLEEPPGEAA